MKLLNKNGLDLSIDVLDNTLTGGNCCIDNSGVSDIYQLYGYDIGGYQINQYACYGSIILELENMSLDEINKRFIKLSDYLRDAQFVGREFRRIQPVYRYSKFRIDTIRGRIDRTRNYNTITDRSFMSDCDSKHIVLYMKDNIFLVKDISCLGEFYRIIAGDYTYDGNYEFYGDVYEEYNDRDKVYLEIMEQIDSYNQIDTRTRIKRR